MSFSLEGKTAIITGAANGVGLEVARHFSDRGANVMLVDMDEEKLQTEAEAIDGDGENVRFFAGDLRKKLTVANLLSATIDAFDSIDILINASRQVLPSNPLDARDDHFEELFQQNVLANLRVTQAVAKRMISQEKETPSEGSIGAVVNLSSIAADRTHAEMLAYSVACAALNQMTRSLAVAFADQRIRVNAIAIGSVMSASLQARLKDDLEVRKATLAATPLGRIAEAREVAETAQFLATDASAFITGQIVTVDGGRSLIDPLEAAAH
ncbi:SDR family oxidoreductase [Amylibacter sp. IMCC11727]|uniref:SDR family NAD(P)-dependent oxidoreductase n=1 Tax=Amylibacter sp. IMCC11727 TaxID=3039851 RepID=UPI00244DE014|nr:SDR family oxidoreductase [Amylibacter sp. IMCC11727]WGI22760.1 SDR family oxidoreductase [Amylibacter sp. IMCC11727]